MSLGRILVADESEAIVKMIRERLLSSGYQVAEAREGTDALRQVKTFSPDLIILDIMLPGMDGYQVARFVRQDPEACRTPILALSNKSGIQEKIAGFEAGADDYLTKPFDLTELELRVRALISRNQAWGQEKRELVNGKIISVFSLRGGTGSTVLSVNMAVTLAQLLEQQIPLVDLSLESSGAGILLDLLPRLTLSHLAKEELSTVDPGILKEYLAPHSSGVLLLGAPTTPLLAEVVTPTLVNQLLTTLRGNYSHVIVDAPHSLGELTLAALDNSDVILLVVPPDMVSLKSATGALETLTSLGYPEERIQVVVNWVFPRRGLPQKEIETALSRPIRAVIPYETDALVRSINEGVPMVLTQPSLNWAQAVEKLIYLLASTEAKEAAEAKGAKRFAQIKKRMAA